MLEGFEKVDVNKHKQFVVVIPRGIRVSSEVAHVIGSRVTLYENGNLLALKTEKEGELKVSIHKRTGSLSVPSGDLAKIIKAKYKCENGTRLQAWVDEGTLVFCNMK